MIQTYLTLRSLLKRRQIHNSRPCAIATTQLLLRVVADFRGKDVDRLISRVRHVGQKLITAQPREMAVGNIVRRVLALIREVIEDDEGPEGSQLSESTSSLQAPAPRPGLPSSISAFSPLKHSGAAQPVDYSGRATDTASETSSVHRPPLMASHTSYSAPLATSLFGLFSGPDTPSPSSTPGFQSPRGGNEKTLPLHELEGLTITDRPKAVRDDFKADVIDGIREILDELDQVDEQIAGYALDQIHSNEIVLTHSSSTTVQKFLLTTRKRKFTVLHVESFPNDHHNTRATMVTGQKNGAANDDEEADVDARFSPLAAGIAGRADPGLGGVRHHVPGEQGRPRDALGAGERRAPGGRGGARDRQGGEDAPDAGGGAERGVQAQPRVRARRGRADRVRGPWQGGALQRGVRGERGRDEPAVRSRAAGSRGHLHHQLVRRSLGDGK